MGAESTVLELEGRSPLARHAPGAILTLVLLSLGHFFIDMYSSALGALQPLLVDKFRMSLTQAGILGGMLLFSSSVMQLFYGWLSDRFHTRLFSALAPAVAGVFISSLGLAPGFSWLLLMVFLGGAGIASFHPQASANATAGLARGRGRAMAIFISSGTLGLSLGPLYFSQIAGRFGLEKTPWGAVPGVLVAVLLMMFLPLHTAPVKPTKLIDWHPFVPVWRPMFLLYLIVFVRSAVQVTYTQFLALYLHLERGYSHERAAFILTLYLMGAAIGGFIGGNLADRFGYYRINVISMGASIPFLFLFLFTTGTLSIVGLVVGAAILLFTVPVNVVMAQRLLPAQTSTVSALMMGFAWGMAGLVLIPLTGVLADHFTLHRTLIAWLVFPIIGLFLTLKLPKD